MSDFHRIDIFCRVIDNYGDIGVCWRLAKDLYQRLSKNQSQHFAQPLRLNDSSDPEKPIIRLFVDDLNALKKIVPDYSDTQQHGVFVFSWNDAEQLIPATWVIETFACELPTPYLDKMSGHTKAWVNLEYLSAESWVESCHLLPSPQANGVKKYFFFPGFYSRTGGLIRESDALTDKPLKLASQLGLAERLRDLKAQGKRLFFYFAYTHAPIHSLLESLPKDVILLAPQLDAFHPQICPIPFVSQSDFDELLQYCGFNFIRGEDSFVRAIWAGKPFLWHIYPQSEQTHIEKLKAWLATTSFDERIQKQFLSWNIGDNFVWDDAMYAHWEKQLTDYRHTLSTQKDLTTQLIECLQKS
ncbi:elongation factor P maturation arginine rhamnosyltransferase EarP [Basilea psittacipulmonis]|uniref:elongation factor P maturation arginine rhamnosyltransferase EarP n=1 Tax=Basilea psittacipulmonis TaxID=1472345 RepID=UPI00068A021D|nr:elongation factor P maturation arginine rhamnosyltransferase EarP [Basilea psittacipulmonis]